MEEWFRAIEYNDFKTVKDYINQGVDINSRDRWGTTALLYAFFRGRENITKLLLIQPNININVTHIIFNDSFIDYNSNRSFLIDYKVQKEILDNQRDDIILLFDKHNLVHPKIKEENPELFQASNWGLI
jgi:ankyrin repeat protein